MIEAFSNASECCEVGLCVKASNLDQPRLEGHLNKPGHDEHMLPCKGDLDVLLVNRETEVQKL